MNIIAPAIARLIETEALLIQNNHWFGEIAPDDTTLERYTITSAALAAVAGKGARAADLTIHGSRLLATMLDVIDADLGGIDAWTRVHIKDDAFTVAQRLRLTATSVRVKASKAANRPRHAAAELPARRVSARSL